MTDALAAKAEAFVQSVLVAVTNAVETKNSATLEKDLQTLVKSFDQAIQAPASTAIAADDPTEPLFSIVKTDLEERMIWGWGSVITVKGEPVVDRQQDIIELSELKQAVYHFMDNHRVGGEMHKLLGVGTVVESLVFSAELQKALKIDLGKEGWFVGVRVDNDATWERVKKGELRSFSLGGSAERVPVA